MFGVGEQTKTKGINKKLETRNKKPELKN